MERGDDARRRWVWVAIGCGGFALSLLCLLPPALWIGASLTPTDEPAQPQSGLRAVEPAPAIPGGLRPHRVRAEVERVEGLARLRRGATCEFDVIEERQADGSDWCNAQVQCGGLLLYGGPRAGYFKCSLFERPERHVVGEDSETTSQDFDGAMRLDTVRGELVVRDDPRGPHGAFVVRARVTDVR